MPADSFPQKDAPPNALRRGGLRGEVPCFVVGWVGWIYPCTGDKGGIFKGRDRVRISNEDGYLLRLDGTSPSLPTDMCPSLLQVGCQRALASRQPENRAFRDVGAVPEAPGRREEVS